MKTLSRLLLIFLITGFSACKEKLPDSYGIYTVAEDEMKTLVPQKVLFKGNMLFSVSGLKEAIGICSAEIDNLIIFQKDINPKDIFLTKLKFQEGTDVPGLFGNTYVDVNLWIADVDIQIKISPVEGKTDMYRIIPVNPLKNGFYAIHFGELTNKETLNAIDKVVYGFVIGTSIKPYQFNGRENNKQGGVNGIESNQNYPAVVVVDQQEFYNKSKELLERINGYFNNKDYAFLHKLYLNPDVSSISDTEWNKLVTGFKIWSTQAGKITSSTITEWNYEGNRGTFKLQTEYLKAGLVTEEMDVQEDNNFYYITFIGTR